MIEQTIHGLSNEQYHFGSPYNQYLSSSQLKKYLISPKAFKYALDNPTEEKSDALRFGSLFHDLMASCAEHYDNGMEAIAQWLRGIAVFEPPTNKSTGKPYGSTSNPYKDAYDAFLQTNEGKIIASNDELATIQAMATSLLCNSGSTSEQVRKLLKWGKPEVSFFYETEDGIKLKVRPDLLTRKKIIDWKTTTSDDLSEEAINKLILRYGYHISASMYQYVLNKITGKWYDFYLVIVSKVPPYDCVMVDMSHGIRDPYTGKVMCYGYHYDKDSDIVEMGCGAMEFKRLLDLHIKCTKENHWPGAEQAIPDNNGVRVLEITPPRYYERKFFDEI